MRFVRRTCGPRWWGLSSVSLRSALLLLLGVLFAPRPASAQATGACCFYDGNCVLVDAYRCFTLQGEYLGDGLVCDPNPCPQPIGACCMADGSCVITTLLQCSLGNAQFLGVDLPCKPNPCPQILGPCCLPSGQCVIITHGQCVEQGGSFSGNNVPCQPTTCAPLPVPPGSWGRIKARYRD